jgi:hypothetical protein
VENVKYVPDSVEGRAEHPAAVLVLKAPMLPRLEGAVLRRGWVRLRDLGDGERRRWLVNYRKAAKAYRDARAPH